MPQIYSALDRINILGTTYSALRAMFERFGLREVVTPKLVQAPSIEPHIEPICSNRGYLVTSPELALKRLLAQGSGPIFEISPVFRSGEEGARHRQEFHLIEWYRIECGLEQVQRDVEELVAAVMSALEEWRGTPTRQIEWTTVDIVTRMNQDCIANLPGFREIDGTEYAHQIAPYIEQLSQRVGLSPLATYNDDEVGQLLAWTDLFTLWSDQFFEPTMRAGAGIHLTGFPTPLCALSQIKNNRAQRFESYIGTPNGGVELANGYHELTDRVEQQRRFEIVNEMRVRQGLTQLPMDPAFLAALSSMPDASGVALGLERIVMAALQVSAIGDFELLSNGDESGTLETASPDAHSRF